MKTRTLLGLALLLPTIAQAQSLTYGPILGRGATADRMIVKWGANANSASTLHFKTHGAATYQTLAATSSCAHSPNCDYEVDVTGLAVGAAYDYYVATGTTNSATFGFNTCPAAGSPLDLVFYGDSRSGGTGGGPAEHMKIAALVRARNPDVVFESGDLYIDGSYNGYLSELFPAVGALVASTPFMSTPGNHDNDSGDLQGNYGAVLPIPRQNPTDPWRAYYSFVCGNVMFIGLDSNQSGDGTQKQFLNDRLTAAGNDATIDHVFVWFHHAPYSVGSHGDDSGTKSSWVPLFDASSKVAAVFSGHDHLYAHMSNGSHVVYVVSGGAGAQKYPVQQQSAATTVKALSAYNYVDVHVAGKSFSGTAYDDTDNVIDTFGGVVGTDMGTQPYTCPKLFSMPGTGMETMVEVRGTFSPTGWSMGAPMTFDSAAQAWQATIDLPANMPIQYKFHYYLNNQERWVADPGNPSMDPASGNSLLSVMCAPPDMAVPGGEADMSVPAGDGGGTNGDGPGTPSGAGCSIGSASGSDAASAFVLCLIGLGLLRRRRRV